MSFFTALLSGHKKSAALLNAVVVRSRADIETFYKSYGFVYTGKFDK